MAEIYRTLISENAEKDLLEAYLFTIQVDQVVILYIRHSARYLVQSEELD